MVEAGNDSVVMEATSHGLALERTRNCRFDVGVVTNVTSEHLEFHGSVEAYRAAKARLVEEAPVAVLNADDPSIGYFLQPPACDRVLTYAVDTSADLRAGNLRPDPSGTTFHLESPRWHGDVRVNLPGRFNVANALASLAAVEALGLDVHHATMAFAHHGRCFRSDGTGRRRSAIHRDRGLCPHHGLDAQGARGASTTDC